jgi:hypothetical protein
VRGDFCGHPEARERPQEQLSALAGWRSHAAACGEYRSPQKPNYWFDSQGIRPQITGEFQDHALLRAFGQAVSEYSPFLRSSKSRFEQQGSLQRIGRTEDVRNRFYAISVERKLKHPAVLAICDTARQLFA